MLFRKPKALLQLGSTPFDSTGPTNDYPLTHNAPLLQTVGPSSSITVKGIALATRSTNHRAEKIRNFSDFCEELYFRRI